MELGHLLTRSGLTYPEVSSKVYHDSFCQLGSSIPKHAGPKAKGSNPTTGRTLLWAYNPFRGNFSHWQVSQKKIDNNYKVVNTFKGVYRGVKNVKIVFKIKCNKLISLSVKFNTTLLKPYIFPAKIVSSRF